MQHFPLLLSNYLLPVATLLIFHCLSLYLSHFSLSHCHGHKYLPITCSFLFDPLKLCVSPWFLMRYSLVSDPLIFILASSINFCKNFILGFNHHNFASVSWFLFDRIHYFFNSQFCPCFCNYESHHTKFMLLELSQVCLDEWILLVIWWFS